MINKRSTRLAQQKHPEMDADDTGAGHLQPLLRQRQQQQQSASLVATDDGGSTANISAGALLGTAAAAALSGDQRPLSSGWAAALAAASAAGSIKAAAKRRTTQAMTGTSGMNRAGAVMGGVKPSRSLFCLSHSNPVRKLTVGVVEWKYPFFVSAGKIDVFTTEFVAVGSVTVSETIETFQSVFRHDFNLISPKSENTTGIIIVYAN